MRRICCMICCCLGLLAVITVIPAFAVKLNTPAPEFTLHDLSGKKISLANFRGKVVILNFWSTTCVPCVAEIPLLADLQREFSKQGLQVVGIAIDSEEKPVRETVEKLKIEYTILMDSSKDVYFDAYALFGQPISIIVDRNGIVREKIIGVTEWTSAQMKNRLQSYLKGR